jgi:hypothetical protein
MEVITVYSSRVVVRVHKVMQIKCLMEYPIYSKLSINDRYYDHYYSQALITAQPNSVPTQCLEIQLNRALPFLDLLKRG